MSKDLRQFLQAVRKAGDEFYVEVKRPLKPKYEVCVIQKKLAAEGRYPVIYCPEIEGSKLPLVSNLFGSYEMLGLALDITPERLKTVGIGGIYQEYRARRNNFKPPKEVPASQAPVREVVLQGKDADLGLLPIIHHNELDAGKYIASGMMICKDPDTGILNVGVYRRQVKEKDKLACMTDPGHHADDIAHRYAELGKPMEVVTFIGHHPAVFMGAIAGVPREINELEVMGALLGEPLEVTPAVTVDLPVPARAEIVIEGIIDPTKMDIDGPFAEAYGYYGERRPCFITQVTAITMRKDAIYHDLDSGHAEGSIVALPNHEATVYEKIKSAVPTLKAVHYGPERQKGIGLMYIAIKKRTQGQGKLAGLAALSADRSIKVAVVVDEDIDVFNEQEVLWAIGTRVRADLDISIIPRMPCIYLNPCAHDETGLKQGVMDAKMLIDATKPVDLPFATRVTSPKELWESMKLEDYLK